MKRTLFLVSALFASADSHDIVDFTYSKFTQQDSKQAASPTQIEIHPNKQTIEGF